MSKCVLFIQQPLPRNGHSCVDLPHPDQSVLPDQLAKLADKFGDAALVGKGSFECHLSWSAFSQTLDGCHLRPQVADIEGLVLQ